MIRHCVFLNFKDDVTEGDKQKHYNQFAALKDIIPGQIADHYGPSASPEGMEHGFTDGFIMDFTDAAARDAYLAHPEHQKAGAALVEACKDGVSGILVFDLEIA
ncbi:Dabb family protein [Roseibium algae]|uniref:Dabb family protein n=1 Tax=Roseibium algae TaxID=3123038 RepID=A0ABU8TGH3_9HYPH